jgi:hypothetical protein
MRWQVRIRRTRSFAAALANYLAHARAISNARSEGPARRSSNPPRSTANGHRALTVAHHSPIATGAIKVVGDLRPGTQIRRTQHPDMAALPGSNIVRLLLS